MYKVFLTLLLSAFLFAPTAANDWSAVVLMVQNALVYVETDDGGCSGWVAQAKRKYVMTAAHCDGKDLLVDRVPAKVVSKDTKKDLMILEVENLNPIRNSLKLADSNPKMGEEVMSAGYGMSLETPFFRKAMVSSDSVMIPENGIGGPFIGVDAAFIEGQSGGPVVNYRGEVVSVVQMASDRLGIGVGATIIRERMGRFLED